MRLPRLPIILLPIPPTEPEALGPGAVPPLCPGFGISPVWKPWVDLLNMRRNPALLETW